MNCRTLTRRRGTCSRGWLIALLAMGLSGCESLFQSDCVLIGINGITVTVVEAASSQTIASTPTVRLIEGDHEEFATPVLNTLPHRLTGAIERTGTYSIIVKAEGYATARRDNVTVTRGGHCNYLQRVEVTIGLSRT